MVYVTFSRIQTYLQIILCGKFPVKKMKTLMPKRQLLKIMQITKKWNIISNVHIFNSYRPHSPFSGETSDSTKNC